MQARVLWQLSWQVCVCGFLYIYVYIYAGVIHAQAVEDTLQNPCTGLESTANNTHNNANNTHKRALLVGIRDYAGQKSHQNINLGRLENLEGTYTDLQEMAKMLHKRGFAVTCVYNEAATSQNIRAAFRKVLIEPTQKDDIALFYYTGHGGQLPERVDSGGSGDSGDSGDFDEIDGLDETLVAYDYVHKDEYTGQILDDEVHAWMQELRSKTSNVVSIFDSCYAGNMRSLGGNESKTRDVEWMADSWDDTGQVVLSAAQEGKPAHEDRIDGKKRSVFTYHLLQTLSNAPTDMSYYELVSLIKLRLKKEGGSQHPVLFGAVGKEFLGASSKENRRFGALWKPISTEDLLKTRGKGHTRSYKALIQAGTAAGLEVGASMRHIPSGIVGHIEKVDLLYSILSFPVENDQEQRQLLLQHISKNPFFFVEPLQEGSADKVAAVLPNQDPQTVLPAEIRVEQLSSDPAEPWRIFVKSPSNSSIYILVFIHTGAGWRPTEGSLQPYLVHANQQEYLGYKFYTEGSKEPIGVRIVALNRQLRSEDIRDLVEDLRIYGMLSERDKRIQYPTNRGEQSFRWRMWETSIGGGES